MKKSLLLDKNKVSDILLELFDAGIIEKRTTYKAIGEPDQDDETGNTQASKPPQSNA